jgi:hypothetical protein
MMDHDAINEAIISRTLHLGDDDATYFTQALYNFAVDHIDDPLVLFKVKVLGYYKIKYGWTQAQAEWFIEHNSTDAFAHTDGQQVYVYDWGRGLNKVTDHMMHEPNLDHIDPVSKSRNNDPSNFRIRCARLNENKGNMTSDLERRATIIDMFKDMDAESQRSLLDYLATVVS